MMRFLLRLGTAWLLTMGFAFIVAADEVSKTPYQVPARFESGYITTPAFDGKVFILQAGREHNRTVIFIHGLGDRAAQDWFSVMDALKARYHVIALDLPGFSHSQNLRGSHSPANYANLIHQIRTRYAKADVTVVGHSMGGAVALRYGADYPDELSRLVLVDAAGILERTAYVKQIADISYDPPKHSQFMTRIVSKLENFSGSVIEWVNLIPDPLPLIHRLNALEIDTGLNDSQMSIALELVNENFTDATRNMTLPTYLIWGEDDPIAPLRTAKVLAHRLKNASLFTFADAGHVPMATHTKAFNAYLLQILDAPVQQTSKKTTVPEASTENLHCVGEIGTAYSGNYNKVIIENSRALHFDNLSARKLMIKNSSAEFENLTLTEGMEADKAVVVVTNGTIDGAVALETTNSRIDMAGVTLHANNYTVKSIGRSRLIFSLCDGSSPHYNGALHGDFRPKHGTILDEQLKKQF